jgi:hypothetical protein
VQQRHRASAPVADCDGSAGVVRIDSAAPAASARRVRRGITSAPSCVKLTSSRRCAADQPLQGMQISQEVNRPSLAALKDLESVRVGLVWRGGEGGVCQESFCSEFAVVDQA